MNQLKDMQRGKLNGTKNAIASGKNFAEQFTFDATGNFANYKQDATGDGTFELNQARTHTKANEIATIAGASTYVANDANGNMMKVVKPDNWSAAYTLVYDAWNRLVQVKDGATVVATYGYNGLNHRVKKVVGSEAREFYYNSQWQCLEEYVGSTCNKRYIWGLRYTDDLVTYRNESTDYYSFADPNWNVIAITNASGAVQERYTYSAFGKLNVFDASFTTRSASTIANTRTYTGQVLDAETGLMLYRNRYYHPTLGRFISRDPIGHQAGDMSLYRYVGNRFLVYTDIFGFLPTCGSTSDIGNRYGAILGNAQSAFAPEPFEPGELDDMIMFAMIVAALGSVPTDPTLGGMAEISFDMALGQLVTGDPTPSGISMVPELAKLKEMIDNYTPLSMWVEVVCVECKCRTWSMWAMGGYKNPDWVITEEKWVECDLDKTKWGKVHKFAYLKNLTLSDMLEVSSQCKEQIEKRANDACKK